MDMILQELETASNAMKQVQWDLLRMGLVGGRGFGGSVKFADGKTSSANVPHLNVWGFDISAAEFPQPKKTRVFGVNRP